MKQTSQLTYNLFAVGACDICNQNLYVRFDNDQGFDDVCRMFQLKSLTFCDVQLGLGIAKWQPWYDRADYRAVDTGWVRRIATEKLHKIMSKPLKENHSWDHLKCLCDQSCLPKYKPSSIVVTIGASCVVLSIIILSFIIIGQKPWKMFDEATDTLSIGNRKIPLSISKTVYLIAVISIARHQSLLISL